jgi:hypothetical protein
MAELARLVISACGVYCRLVKAGIDTTALAGEGESCG